MDKVIQLQEIVAHEVSSYAKAHGWKENLYYLEDKNTHLYAAIGIPEEDHPYNTPGFIVMAQIVEDKVIILVDNTDHYLDDALIQAGIPKEKIILKYQKK